MRDRYNEPDVIDILGRWAESRNGRITGHRAQLGIGIMSLAGGAAFFIEGLWNHDFEHIATGVAGVSTGGFLTKYAQVQLEQIHEEVPYRN
jgi:hypothetical protein